MFPSPRRRGTDLHALCSLRKTYRDALHIAEMQQVAASPSARACVDVADITEHPRCVLYPWITAHVGRDSVSLPANRTNRASANYAIGSVIDI